MIEDSHDKGKGSYNNNSLYPSSPLFLPVSLFPLSYPFSFLLFTRPSHIHKNFLQAPLHNEKISVISYIHFYGYVPKDTSIPKLK